MSVLIKGGRVIDPASGLDAIADVAVADGRVVGIQTIPADFRPSHILEASACVVAPGLIDLAARLREPGHEHARMLESEMAAAVAGGVTRLVCPPDTDPVLDEPGLVEMLRFRSEKLNLARLHPLGALTRKLAGDTLTDMVELSEAGCVAFSQAELPLANTLVMQRAVILKKPGKLWSARFAPIPAMRQPMKTWAICTRTWPLKPTARPCVTTNRWRVPSRNWHWSTG